MNWVINEKLHRPFVFAGCVLILSVNLMMVNVCVRLLFYAWTSMHMDWYEDAFEWHFQNIDYFWERSESVAVTVGVAALFIIGFSVFVLAAFRKMQTEEKRKIMGIYFTCGYEKETLWRLLAADRMIYLAFGIAPAQLLTTGMMSLCERREEFRFVILAGGGYGIVGLISMICCAIFAWAVMEAADRYCMGRILREPKIQLIKESR